MKFFRNSIFRASLRVEVVLGIVIKCESDSFGKDRAIIKLSNETNQKCLSHLLIILSDMNRGGDMGR